MSGSKDRLLAYAWARSWLVKALKKEGPQRGRFTVKLACACDRDTREYYERMYGGVNYKPNGMDVYFDGHKIDGATPELHQTLRAWVKYGVVEIKGRIPYDHSFEDTRGTGCIPLPGETIEYRVTDFGERQVTLCLLRSIGSG